MLYDEKSYIDYHNRGDAGVECSLNARICKALKLSEFDKFRYLYFYSMTYNIESALDMLNGEREIKKLKFNRDNTDIEFFNNETAFYAATICKEHATLYFIATLSKGRGEGRAMFRFLCEKCRKLGKKRIRLKAHEDVRGFYEKLGCVIMDFDTKDNSYVMEYRI